MNTNTTKVPNKLMDYLAGGQTGLAHVAWVKNKVCEGKATVDELIALCFHPNQQIAFHSAWVLEGLVESDYLLFGPHLDMFLAKFSSVTNLSVKRHFTKIMILLDSIWTKLDLRSNYSNIHFPAIIETCFDWLINERTPVAVKANCIEVLALLAKQEAWIAPELLLIMDDLVAKESIAFFARVKKIKKRLLKQ